MRANIKLREYLSAESIPSVFVLADRHGIGVVYDTLYDGPLCNLTSADHLIPARECLDNGGNEALHLLIPGVGPVLLSFETDEDTGERTVSASIVKEG